MSEVASHEGALVGYLASFADPNKVLHAVESLRDKGYKRLDVHTPYPLHGMDEALNLKPSILGWLAGLGAAGAGVTALALQGYTSAIDYPIVVSGKPLFSFEAFIPITFELAVLGAALFTVFGMLVLNGLPRPYHPFFHGALMAKASDDRFVISIPVEDPGFDVNGTEAELRQLGAEDIELVREEW